MSFYLIAAFGGPIIGPLSGSFLAAATSYTWIFWLLTIFAGVSFLTGTSSFAPDSRSVVLICAVGACVPETYAPVRLRRLAAARTKATGVGHRSAADSGTRVDVGAALRVSLVRPFQMLVREGIVAFFAVYSGFICELFLVNTKDTANSFFRRTAVRLLRRLPMVRAFLPSHPVQRLTIAFRIYHRERGWSTGIASLPFIAVGLGMLFAVLLNLYLNKSYVAKTRALGTQLPPESRLTLCCAGGVVLPVGLMIFAFTADPGVHWVAPCIAGTLFGFGFVGIFLSMTVSWTWPLCVMSRLIWFISRICWIRIRCTPPHR
jgi:hypothetical protein